MKFKEDVIYVVDNGDEYSAYRALEDFDTEILREDWMEVAAGMRDPDYTFEDYLIENGYLEWYECGMLDLSDLN